jgi:hypothetical protein
MSTENSSMDHDTRGWEPHDAMIAAARAAFAEFMWRFDQGPTTWEDVDSGVHDGWLHIVKAARNAYELSTTLHIANQQLDNQ